MAVSSHHARLTVPVSDQDHGIGAAGAPVTLLEYGDYECPFCRRAYPVVEELRQEFGSSLRFVFRHFPLSKAHPHSRLAAMTAEAAGAQERFWEMHHLLFINQKHLEVADLLKYAQELGLDAARVGRELEELTWSQRVQEDFRGGVRSGANQTPTFFINGLRHDDGHDRVSLHGGVIAALGNSEAG